MAAKRKKRATTRKKPEASLAGMSAAERIDFQARVVVTALYESKEDTCKRFNISERTLQRYRVAAEASAPVAKAVAEKKEMADREWLTLIPAFLAKAARFLGRAADEADHKNPQVIRAVAGAMKLGSEAVATRDTVDARVARQTGADGAATSSPIARLADRRAERSRTA